MAVNAKSFWLELKYDTLLFYSPKMSAQFSQKKDNSCILPGMDT